MKRQNQKRLEMRRSTNRDKNRNLKQFFLGAVENDFEVSIVFVDTSE